MLHSSTASLFRSVKTGSLVLAALLGASVCAHAGTETTDSKDMKDKNVIQKPMIEPKFWIDLAAGGEFDFHSTKFLTDSGGNFAPSPAISLPAKIQSRDFESTHDAAVVTGRGEVGYKVLPYMSLFIGGMYSHAGGQTTRRVGSVEDVNGAYGAAGGVYNLYGNFGQYQAYSGFGGVKLNTPRTILDLLHIPKFVSPYASFSAGGKYLDAQQVDFFAKDGRIVSSGHDTLYNSGWVFTGEAELGYEAKFTRNFSVTVESGYGYDTKPQHEGVSDVNHPNRAGDRFYSTVNVGAKLAF